MRSALLIDDDDDEGSDLPRALSHKRTNSCHVSQIFRRPRPLILSLLAIVFLFVVSSPFWSERSSKLAHNLSKLPSSLLNPTQPCDNPPWLKPPLRDIPLSRKVRDMLLPDRKYVTSFLTGGWTNDVMAYAHTLQIALITQRVPILGPFSPTHIGYDTGLIKFSDIFDINFLSRSINLPILEWHQVKNLTNPDPAKQASPQFHGYYGGDTEDIGCWSVWMTQRGNGEPAREGSLPDALGLDVSWTPIPFGKKLDNTQKDEIVVSIYGLSELAYPQHRTNAIAAAKAKYVSTISENIKGDPEPWPLPAKLPVPNHSGKQLDPDEQLVCYDYLYFVAAYSFDEWRTEASPQWHQIGIYMKWAAPLKSLAETYVRRAFKVQDTSPVPLYISVHIRRADFGGWCDVPEMECFAPLSAYARRVQQVRDDLTRKGIPGTEKISVLVSTDEPHVTPEGRPAGESEAWWASVKALGWAWVDHNVEQTEERYGKWYPSLLDACMQSLASGFVGTDRSTYSLLSALRVASWADGPTRMVKWGSKDADVDP